MAISETPGGPFRTTHVNVTLPGKGRVGDFNILVDDDGSAYHVRTGFDIVKLNADFTGPQQHVASFSTPLASEGPTFFKVREERGRGAVESRCSVMRCDTTAPLNARQGVKLTSILFMPPAPLLAQRHVLYHCRDGMLCVHRR